MAGAYEPEEDESSIDLVPQEKKTVSIDSNIPGLLNLFSRPATTDTQPKEDIQPKGKKRYWVLRDTPLILKCTLIIGPYVFLPLIESRLSTSLETSSTMTMKGHTG